MFGYEASVAGTRACSMESCSSGDDPCQFTLQRCHVLSQKCIMVIGKIGLKLRENLCYKDIIQFLDLEIIVNIKVVKYIEMPKACPKKSMCHFQKLEMILK